MVLNPMAQGLGTSTTQNNDNVDVNNLPFDQVLPAILQVPQDIRWNLFSNHSYYVREGIDSMTAAQWAVYCFFVACQTFLKTGLLTHISNYLSGGSAPQTGGGQLAGRSAIRAAGT